MNKVFCTLMFISTLTLSRSSNAMDLEVVNSCIANSTKLSFHALFEISYSKINGKKPEAGKEKLFYVYQFNCSLTDKTCDGVQINLTNKSLSLMSVGTTLGAKVVASTPSTKVITWGPMRTFTVDLEKKIVTYSESAGDTEGRAEAKCN